AEQPGESTSHLLFHRTQLGRLSKNYRVDVYDPPSILTEPSQRFVDEQAGIAITVNRVGVREDVADVTEAGCAEQGIGQRVQHDVRVAVASQPARMLDADTAENQRSAFHQSVCVVSDADAHARNLSWFESRGL